MTVSHDVQDRLRKVLTHEADRAPVPVMSPEQFRRMLPATPAATIRRNRVSVPLRRTAAAATVLASAADTAPTPSTATVAPGPDCLGTIPGQRPDKGLPQTWLTTGSLDNVAVTEPNAAQPILVLSVKAPDGNSVNAAPVSWVSGRVTSSVARVSIQTSQGRVLASRENGVFAAWWPGSDNGTAVIHAYDSAGRLLSTIDELNCRGTTVAPRIQTPGHPTLGGCTSPTTPRRSAVSLEHARRSHARTRADDAVGDQDNSAFGWAANDQSRLPGIC